MTDNGVNQGLMDMATVTYNHEKSAPGYATTDKEFSGEEMDFLNAIEQFKKRTGKKFPSWTDALYVARTLGYTKMVFPEERHEDMFAVAVAI